MEQGKLDVNYVLSFVQSFLKERYRASDTLFEGPNGLYGSHMWFEGNGKFHLLVFVRGDQILNKDEVRVDLEVKGAEASDVVAQIINGLNDHDSRLFRIFYKIWMGQKFQRIESEMKKRGVW